MPELTDQRTLTKDELLEQVRVNLLRYLERYQHMTLAQMAKKTGYSYEALKAYRNQTQMTVPVAAALVRVYPEIGDGLVCRHCGHLQFVS